MTKAEQARLTTWRVKVLQKAARRRDVPRSREGVPRDGREAPSELEGGEADHR